MRLIKGLQNQIRRREQNRQVVLRDSGSGWIQLAGRRAAMDGESPGDLDSAVLSGFGFAWLPEKAIREHPMAGRLQPLPLDQGRRRDMTFHLNFRNADALGPAAQDFLRAMRLNARPEQTRPVV